MCNVRLFIMLAVSMIVGFAVKDILDPKVAFSLCVLEFWRTDGLKFLNSGPSCEYCIFVLCKTSLRIILHLHVNHS